ncbi:MAG: hypothetical protein ACR2NM_01800 [Bythopirellula sp.]
MLKLHLQSATIATLVLVSTSTWVWADHHEGLPKQDPAKQQDPLGEYFIPPELVMQHGQELGIDEQTLSGIRDEVMAVQAAVPPLQEKMQEEVRKLRGKLQSGSDDEAAVLAQFDRVLNQELKVKRLHIRLLYRIRQQLSDSQFKELMKLKTETMARHEEIKLRLQAKVAQVQKIVQQRVKAGRPPHEVARLMQSFAPLMKKGQIEAAEAILERAMEQLEGE